MIGEIDGRPELGGGRGRSRSEGIEDPMSKREGTDLVEEPLVVGSLEDEVRKVGCQIGKEEDVVETAAAADFLDVDLDRTVELVPDEGRYRAVLVQDEIRRFEEVVKVDTVDLEKASHVRTAADVGAAAGSEEAHPAGVGTAVAAAMTGTQSNELHREPLFLFPWDPSR